MSQSAQLDCTVTDNLFYQTRDSNTWDVSQSWTLHYLPSWYKLELSSIQLNNWKDKNFILFLCSLTMYSSNARAIDNVFFKCKCHWQCILQMQVPLTMYSSNASAIDNVFFKCKYPRPKSWLKYSSQWGWSPKLNQFLAIFAELHQKSILAPYYYSFANPLSTTYELRVSFLSLQTPWLGQMDIPFFHLILLNNSLSLNLL
jgi:hypothetical protein